MVLGALDLYVSSCTYYATPLRPVAGLLRARKGRKFFEVLKKMVPGMIHNLVPILFFALVAMSLCCLMFDLLIPDLFRSTYFSFYNWWFLILTNDTFDRLLPETVFKSLAYLVFFFPAIYVGQRFLVSMIIGDTYNTYKSYVKKQLKKEKLKELQGLTKAFTALDEHRKGQISDVVWRECMTALSPDLSHEAIALYYELISGGNENITVLQFLSLRNILSFRLTVDTSNRSYLWSAVRVVQRYVRACYQSLALPQSLVPESLSVWAAGVLDSVVEGRDLVSKLNFIDVLILCGGLSEVRPTLSPAAITASLSPIVQAALVSLPVAVSDRVSSLSQYLPGAIFDDSLAWTSPLTVCECVSLLYVIEYVIRLLAAKGKASKVTEFTDSFAISWSASFFALGCLGTLFLRPLLRPLLHSLSVPQTMPDVTSGTASAVTAATAATAGALGLRGLFSLLGSSPQGVVQKCALVLRLLRTTRMLSLNEDLKNFSAALYDVMPALLETFTFTFIVSYMFGTAGTLFFGGQMNEWKTPLLGVVKAQQLTFMVGFLDSMEAAVEQVSTLAIAYFLCFLILSLTVSNIALSIIIDLHGSVMDMKSNEREGQKKKIDIVFDKLVSQARARRWVKRSESGGRNMALNFKNIRLSEFQSSDVRHFVAASDGDDGDGSKGGLSVKDLEACQKHAKIDLVKFYAEQHRHHKDLHWEVDFLKSLHDLDKHEARVYQHGEVLFSRGERANTLFLLNKGSVRLLKDNEVTGVREETRFFASNFLGAECLAPHGRYGLTCIAESDDTSVSLFSQDDVAHQMDSETSGGVLKMIFKSSSAIDTAFAEAKKGSRRFSLSRGPSLSSSSFGVSASHSARSSPALPARAFSPPATKTEA